MWKKTINICHLSKNVFRKNFHAKKFQCLKFHTIFSTNGSKCMEKQSMTINFCHLLKYGFRQVLPCQKISVFEVEYNFLISGTNCMWMKTINFCNLSKNKFIQVKTSKPKIQCLKWIYFFQPKEQNICGRRLSILATFQKTIYPGKNFYAKNFSKWNWI